MEAIVFKSTSDFIFFLISPPLADNLNPSLREDFLVFGSILYDVIWKLRNRSLFENAVLNFDGVASRISKIKNQEASPQDIWFQPLLRFGFLPQGWT